MSSKFLIVEWEILILLRVIYKSVSMNSKLLCYYLVEVTVMSLAIIFFKLYISAILTRLLVRDKVVIVNYSKEYAYKKLF